MSAKHPISIYTMMMILATIFMFLACVFMGVEWARYDGSPAPRVHFQSASGISNWA
ncbi:MAG: hypothetical protein ACOVLE_00365 [Pirellula staleyi]|jgi:hypothetical protein